MATTEVRADTALVIGAVVVAGGILLLLYTIEQDTTKAATKVYNDITDAPGKILSAIGSGAQKIYNGVSNFVSGDSGKPSDESYDVGLQDQLSADEASQATGL